MRFLPAFFIATTLLFTGCSSSTTQTDDLGEPTDDNDVEDQIALASSWTIEAGEGIHAVVDAKPFAIRLYRDDEEVMVWGPEALGFGEVDEIIEDRNYDPYWLHQKLGALKADPPAGLQWNPITEVTQEINDGDDSVVTLNVALGLGGSAELTVHPSVSGVIKLHIKASSERPTAYIFAQWPAAEGENFYGLGESFDQVARRGTHRAMQFEPLPSESGYNEAHVPVPFLTSTEGPGWFFESRLPMYFDVASEDPDTVRMEVGWASELTIHLMNAETPALNIGRYHAITGQPLVPPYWAFAPQFWRNETQGQEEVLEDLQKIREHDIPAGVFWIDRPWQKTYNDFIFDPEKYDAPQEMIDQMNDLGFELVLWSAPYTSEESDAWEQCSTENYFYEGPKLFTKFGLMMDLTHPDAMQLWQDMISRTVVMGAKGFKLDYGEDVQVGVLEERIRIYFHDGSDELTMHHLYSYYFQKAYFEALKSHLGESSPHGVDGFVLGRTGTYGGQTVAHAIWPGDLDSDFRTHMEDNFWVGGLPASIIGGLTLGASGYPFYGSDTGGFRNGRPTSDVLVRWAWQTALSPIMQIGGSGSNHFAWEPGKSNEPQYDENTLRDFRGAAKLGMRLATYRFTLGLEAWKTGVPVMRPFGLMYPDDGRHPDDTYLLGPDLLVAPIISEDPKREVPIPAGRWIDFWTGAVDAGPTSVEREVPMDSIALWLREGAIVPMLRHDADTLTSTKDPDVVSVIQDPGTLTWVVAPGEDNSYINHDESSLSHLTSESIRMELKSGSLFTNFAIDLRLGLGTDIPENLQWQGEDISAVESMEEYEACTEPCYLSQEEEGRIQIYLGELSGDTGSFEAY